MIDMTVKIFPATNGRVAFETCSGMPHKKGKFIAGFAANEDDAIRRVKLYIGDSVNFIRTDA